MEEVARLLAAHRKAIGTRKGTRKLGPFKQAVLVIRWFVDAERVRRLWEDNQISRSTAYSYLEEGIEVTAARAPGLKEHLEAAAQARLTHLNLGGTVVQTDQVPTPGLNGADLWWSGKHKHHGGNVQVVSTPDGWPLWVSQVRPGREHDTTCAKTARAAAPAGGGRQGGDADTDRPAGIGKLTTTTDHHPFYDTTQSAFIDAAQLQPGDHLQQPDGHTAEVLTLYRYTATQTPMTSPSTASTPTMCSRAPHPSSSTTAAMAVRLITGRPT